MTLYRISVILLVLSVACLAGAIGMTIPFYILISWVCVLLAAQLYASAVKQEHGDRPAGRR
jgi:hypothetical protein